MSELSQSRIKDVCDIPEMFSKGQFSCAGTKKGFPSTQLVSSKLDDNFPALKNHQEANYFVEI